MKVSLARTTLVNEPHMSITLDQIPVDKTLRPTDSSWKMKPVEEER